MKLIDKSALVAEIESRIKSLEECFNGKFPMLQSVKETEQDKGKLVAYKLILSFTDTLEVKEMDLYNNGWIDCTKQMPPETKQTSDTLQGHREWTESDRVLVWDSMYGCSVDATKNGKWMSERKWMSEQRGGYTGQVVHGIIAWRPIPEFSEELLVKVQKGE